MSASAAPSAPAGSPADAGRCPLCGTANGCAVAASQATGDAPARCWCIDATIGAATLARIPPVARGQACICARCAAAPSLA